VTLRCRVVRSRPAAAALLLALPALLGAVGCSSGDAAGVPCDGKLASPDPAAALPAGIPAGVTGATFYAVEKQGTTKRYQAHVEGGDVVATRDAILDAFARNGYEIPRSDAEGQAEAEFEFVKDPIEGSVQVTPLCDGHLRLRYRVSPR
jgi:hypothetical protein